MFRDISSVDAMPSHIEPPSRLFGLSSGKTNFRSNLLSQDSSRLNMQFGNRNIVDRISEHGIRTSMVQSTTIGTRSFGFQSRNLTSDSTTFPEGSFRLNQEIRQRSNSASAVSKPFWPAVRNTTLTTGLQVQDSVRYNDDIVDNDGFRRPRGFGIIRGRNSTLSSRLFHHQNAETHFKDLSNINGFNVSHISRREGDTLSESRLPLGMRSNWMENQSLSGSVISVVSMKAQFMNLLENLHHSILSIGPHATAEAVRSEFDKAKQGLENISEMSFAPTIKPADTASVVSQSSKYFCPPSNSEPPTRTNTIDGGSLHLKSSNDLLKTLISSKTNYKRKFNLSPHVEEREERDAVITSSRNKGSDDEENSSFVFKKPKPQVSRRYTPRMKIKAAPAVKKSLPKEENNAINLKQWYPVAIGATLAFCGVDENGASVKTDAVKKRLNNRKVELITGFDCNLIGSPSTMISALPQKILKLLKNGLTDRWRVLQRELLNCQTVEEETKKRKSKSPRTKDAEEKIQKPTGKENSKRPKVISTPKKRGRELHTRSGRAVKPPGLFWLANGSNEITSSFELSETTIREVPTMASRKSNTGSPEKKPKRPPSLSPSKKSKKPNEESPKKKANKAKKASPGQKYKKPSPNKKQSKASPKQKNKKVVEESPGKKEKKTSEETPIRRDKKASEASPIKKEKKTTSEETPVRRYKKAVGSPKGKEKTSRVASPSKSKTTEGSTGKGNKKQPVEKKGKDSKQEKEEEEVTVHSSTEDAKLQGKARPTRGKRKREAGAEADSVEPKKSKLEKKTDNQVESTVASTETETKGGKNTKKGRLAICPVGSKSKGKKSPTDKKTTTAKKKTDKNAAGKTHNETEEFTEFEKNFEFKLDDIEIPEIANVSSNPHLSRSQLRLVCMETPPLKYFNSNLRLMGSTTPMRSPDWCISQRTASEVKQFQRRREEAFKKRVKAETKKTVVTEKIVQNKDVKRVMQWVAEKNVRSPQWNSKVLQYVIPSRKRMEEAEDEEDEDADTEFF